MTTFDPFISGFSASEFGSVASAAKRDRTVLLNTILSPLLDVSGSFFAFFKVSISLRKAKAAALLVLSEMSASAKEYLVHLCGFL